MSPNIVGLLGIALLIILLFSRMWVGATMAFVGFFGYAYLSGITGALGIVSTLPYMTIADYLITVLPLFILMGNIVSETGICGDLYTTGHKWMGSLPGGLAMGTIGACAGFAAITGTSLACAITFGKIAIPEMKRFKYNTKLASGCVAAGSGLGVLIPPSIGFILYSILTEESVGLLFMAGVLPGILLALFYMITIFIVCKRNPIMGPPGEKIGIRQKIASLKFTWAVISLFLFVMGGIYMGVFTPNEAGAIGSVGAIIVTLIGKRLKWRLLVKSFLDSVEVTAMIVVLICGAMIFMRFLAITMLPTVVSEFVAGLELSRFLIFTLIVVFYVLCGMFLDVVASIMLTIPIIYPTITALGFDPIWFGVIVVLIMEMGMITPPIGMNVFVLSGVTNIPIGTIFRGIIPFFICQLVFIIFLTAFPDIALILPKLMMGN